MNDAGPLSPAHVREFTGPRAGTRDAIFDTMTTKRDDRAATKTATTERRGLAIRTGVRCGPNGPRDFDHIGNYNFSVEINGIVVK